MFSLFKYGFHLLAPFFVHLQARLDSWLAEEAPPGAPEGEKKKGLPAWAIILIVVVVLCLIGICAYVIVGQVIGNVYSNVIEGIETPAP